MNHIEALLEKLCPQGVEFKSLGDCVVENRGGGTPSKSKPEFWDGDIPWASVGDLSHAESTLVSTRKSITHLGVEGSSTKVIPAGWVVVAVKITPGRMKITATDIAINQDLRGLKLDEQVDVRFVYYYFNTLNLVGNGTIVQGITNQTLERIRIPVPPMEVQLEIVRILDAMTSLQAELQAELKQRQVQFEFLRSKYFDDLVANPSIQNSPLVDVCDDFIVPMRDRPKIFDGEIPWCRIEDIQELELNGSLSGLAVSEEVIRNMNLKVMPTGTVIASCSASLGRYAITKTPLITNQTFIGLVCGSSLDNQYLLFALQAKTAEITRSSNTATIAYIPRRKFEELLIPLPSLDIQKSIAGNLWKFQELLKVISEELEARRKQYEYYRDKLLTFKELVA